jgi:chromosome segregation ATPase
MEQADDEDDDDTIQVSRRKHRAMQDKLMLYESAFPDLTREQLLELTNLSRRGGSASTRAHTIDTLSKKVATLERKNARLDEDLEYSEDRSWNLKEKLKTTQEELVATQRSAEMYEDTAGQNVLQLHTFQGRLATSQTRHAVTQRELSASIAREQQYQVQLTAAADRERQFQLQIGYMQRRLEVATGSNLIEGPAHDGDLAKEGNMDVDPAQENTDVCRRGLGCRQDNCQKQHPGRGW